jgi:predicted hotdog family 3-hydroxylacyl-ACP dehydratase
MTIPKALPIDGAFFLNWMPHRKPMFWIDALIDCPNINEGICEVELKSNAHYMHPNGYVRASSMVEFTAQAYGVTSIYQAVLSVGVSLPKVNKSYLVAIKNAELLHAEQQLTVENLGPRLTIKVQKLKKMNSLVIFNGEVHSNKLGLVHRSQLRVYYEMPTNVSY